MKNGKHWWGRWVPGPETLLGYRALAPLRPILGHHRLWQFNRRSVAGGLAVGLFFSIALPIAQIPFAALLAVMLKVNLPLAIVGTLISNPLTTPAILFLALQVGAFVLDYDRAALAWPEPAAELVEHGGALASIQQWTASSLEWAAAAGAPLAAGVGVLAIGLSVVGYFAVLVGWRVVTTLRWRRRGKPCARVQA